MLDKREKVVAMVEMAQLTTAECVAVLSIAKFEEMGEDDGLEDRMKQPMHSIFGNIMGKEMEPGTQEVLETKMVLRKDRIRVRDRKARTRPQDVPRTPATTTIAITDAETEPRKRLFQPAGYEIQPTQKTDQLAQRRTTFPGLV